MNCVLKLLTYTKLILAIHSTREKEIAGFAEKIKAKKPASQASLKNISDEKIVP